MAKLIKQTFLMCHSVQETVEEKLEYLKEVQDQEYIDMVTEDLKEEPLVVPVDTIQFGYPYWGKDHLIFLDKSVTTKRQLINACVEKLPPYFNEHPYSAPHGVEDFVIETIYVYTSGVAYISIGS